MVVLEGLAEGETLVIEGIQKVRPGAEVSRLYRTPAEQPEIIEQEATPETEPEDQIPRPIRSRKLTPSRHPIRKARRKSCSAHSSSTRPKFAFVIAIVTIIAGLLAIAVLPIAEYPELTPPQVQVSAKYPGADAKVVAETVAAVIEGEVNGVEGMTYMSSKSSNDGSYTLTVTFSIETDRGHGTGQRAEPCATGVAEAPRGGQAPGRHYREELHQHADGDLGLFTRRNL